MLHRLGINYYFVGLRFVVVCVAVTLTVFTCLYIAGLLLLLVGKILQLFALHDSKPIRLGFAKELGHSLQLAMEAGLQWTRRMVVLVERRHSSRRDDLNVRRGRPWARGRARVNPREEQRLLELNDASDLEFDGDVGAVPTSIRRPSLYSNHLSVAKDGLERPAKDTATLRVGGEKVGALDVNDRANFAAWVVLRSDHGVVVLLSCFCFFMIL